jgi:hypothetical protein
MGKIRILDPYFQDLGASSKGCVGTAFFGQL